MAHIATWCINIEFNSCVMMCVNIDYSNIQSELRAKNRSCCNSLKIFIQRLHSCFCCRSKLLGHSEISQL